MRCGLRSKAAQGTADPGPGVRGRIGRALVAATLLAGAGSRLWAEDPLRVQVNLVNVGFTVRDASGALVDGVKREQVRVLEDGAPQTIAFFSQAQGVPLTLGLIVDVSGSQDHFTKQHAHDLEVFLNEVLRPQDKVFLVCFGNHIRLVSEMTNSAADVLARLGEFHRHGGGGIPELGPKEDRNLGTAFYDAIFYSVNERLAGAQGKHALVVFSDGEDNSSSHDMMATIEEAQRANAQVYTVRYTDHPAERMNARNRYGVSVMNRFAEETGALAIDTSAVDASQYFRRIGDELRSSYELAYYPSNRERDNTFRRVTITVDRAEWKVRSRTGYYARAVRPAVVTSSAGAKP